MILKKFSKLFSNLIKILIDLKWFAFLWCFGWWSRKFMKKYSNRSKLTDKTLQFKFSDKSGTFHFNFLCINFHCNLERVFWIIRKNQWNVAMKIVFFSKFYYIECFISKFYCCEYCGILSCFWLLKTLWSFLVEIAEIFGKIFLNEFREF
jgi:hypothetical protein